MALGLFVDSLLVVSDTTSRTCLISTYCGATVLRPTHVCLTDSVLFRLDFNVATRWIDFPSDADKKQLRVKNMYVPAPLAHVKDDNMAAIRLPTRCHV